MRPPDFWHQRQSLLARGLVPVSWLWRLGALGRRLWVHPARVSVPVICVGNLTIGGAGKTPVVLHLAACLQAQARRPHLIGHGYGGRLPGPERVDPKRHQVTDVGDEALLLAETAPTWIGHNRQSSAAAAVAAGADVLVLDDGYQDPGLRKDLSLVVVDGGFGFGNGRVVPAGPLREPLASGLRRADAVVVLGPDRAGVVDSIGPDIPVLHADWVFLERAVLSGHRVRAFCGIGLPDKFRASLQEMGCRIEEMQIFADHHPYRPGDIEPLLERARRSKSLVVTTQKDAVRVPTDLRANIVVSRVAVRWRHPDRLKALLDQTI